MKRLAWMIVLLATGAMAQIQDAPAQQQAPKIPKFQSNLVTKPQAPTYSDINCSGFVTKESIPTRNVVVGGEHSPHTSQFAGRDTIFLSGEGFTVGARYRILRRVSDKNKVESFPGEYKLGREAGDQWADLGYTHVTQIVDGTPLALIDFSCQPVVVGDILMPYEDRPTVPFSKNPLSFQEFGVPTSGTVGRIVQAKDFDYLLATGKKVYLNIGADKGLKPGDYLRVTRGYDWIKDSTPIDRLSTKATMSEDTSDRMPRVEAAPEKKFPRRGLGEMIVLWTTPNSAVALITVAREDMHIGDQVELEMAKP